MLPSESEYYEAIGRALTSWADLENAVCLVFTRATIDDFSGTAEAAYWEVASFEARLKMTDAAVQARYTKHPECLRLWKTLYNACNRRKRVRNKLAHGQLVSLGIPWDESKNERYFSPFYHKRLSRSIREANAFQRDDHFTHVEKIYLKEIKNYEALFRSLYYRILSFSRALPKAPYV
ncbi:MAG: hypothetical protein RKE49_02795 [Oceanicaulis sp.]